MLILTRKPRESIVIAENVTVTPVRCSAGRVRLSIDAPDHIRVVRKELVDAEPDPDEVAA